MCEVRSRVRNLQVGRRERDGGGGRRPPRCPLGEATPQTDHPHPPMRTVPMRPIPMIRSTSNFFILRRGGYIQARFRKRVAAWVVVSAGRVNNDELALFEL